MLSTRVGTGDARTADCEYPAAAPAGGSGNAPRGSRLLRLRSCVGVVAEDGVCARTGAITDEETERGGTILDGAAREGTYVGMCAGRGPGFECVRVRARAAAPAFASFAADETGGRDSVAEAETERVMADAVCTPAVRGRRRGRGTAARAAVFCELATEWWALESREPEETMELADAFDCVRPRAGPGSSIEVMLSVSIVLRREKDVEAERERARVDGREIGENEVGACGREPMEDDLESLEGARGAAVEG